MLHTLLINFLIYAILEPSRNQPEGQLQRAWERQLLLNFFGAIFQVLDGLSKIRLHLKPPSRRLPNLDEGKRFSISFDFDWNIFFYVLTCLHWMGLINLSFLRPTVKAVCCQLTPQQHQKLFFFLRKNSGVMIQTQAWGPEASMLTTVLFCSPSLRENFVVVLACHLLWHRPEQPWQLQSIITALPYSNN